MQNTTIREASIDDVPAIIKLCHLHAGYEHAKISGAMLTATRLSELIFGESAPIRCLVAVVAGEVVGYATFAVQFSTWQARRYLYLDCLFLTEASRGRGLGREVMLRVREAARLAECQHVEWQTPGFNTEAIGFYRRLGAESAAKERFVWAVDEGGEAAMQPAEAAGILPPPESLAEPYRPRPSHMSQVRNCNGWQMKVYEITRTGKEMEPAVVDAAMGCVLDKVPWPTETDVRFGFVVLNEGEQALWALAHVWMNDLLHQFLYYAPLDNITQFQVSPMPGFTACVWDLEVTKHERDAWVKHVMSSPRDPRFADYLQDTLTIPSGMEPAAP